MSQLNYTRFLPIQEADLPPGLNWENKGGPSPDKDVSFATSGKDEYVRARQDGKVQYWRKDKDWHGKPPGVV